MAARNPARYLAPVALAAILAGGYVIVHSNISASAHHVNHRTVHRVPTGPRGHYRRDRYYTVQAGNNMTSIAHKTGVPLATLESLNRTVNPNALQTGQRLRLRR